MLESIISRQPEVLNIFDVAGYSFTGNRLEQDPDVRACSSPWEQRQGSQAYARRDSRAARRQLYLNPMGIQAFAVNPPAIPGLVSKAVFDFELEDRGSNGLGPFARSGPIKSSVKRMRRTAVWAGVLRSSPTTRAVITVNVDRNKAQALGVNLAMCTTRCRCISARSTSTTSTSAATRTASTCRPITRTARV